MKRRLATLLAALMLLSCLTPAFAAGLFEEYGDIDNWTEEQWVASETWTDEQWEEYWTDYDIWYEETYGNWDDEDWWQEYITGVKTDLGMPYPEGINVCLKGSFLTFGDVAPTAVDGRTMVPFRSLLEGMGAQVDYDGGLITARFPEGKTIQMELGNRTLRLTDGAQEETVEMDVAPWVDEKAGRTYIPVRFAGQALGLDVYWDGTYETVYLIDWAEVQAQVDSRFTVLNHILAASWKTVDQKKTYLSKDNISLSGTLYGEKEDDTATLSLKGESLTRGYQYSGSYQLGIDLGGLEDTLFSVLGEDQKALLHQLDGSKYQLMMDLNSGDFYVKGDKLDQLSDNMLPRDQWIHMAYDGMAELVAQYETLLEQAPTMGGIIAGMMKSYYEMEMFTVDLEETLAVCDLLLGDSNFKTSKLGSTTTYTADMGLVDLFQRASELGLLEDVDVLDLLFGENNIPTGRYQFTAVVKGEELSKLTLTGNVRIPGAVPFEVGFSVTGDSKSAQALFTFKGDYVGKLEFKADSAVSTTTRTVTTEPAEGEQAAELEDLMAAYWERQYSQDGWNSYTPYPTYDYLATVLPF